eukprot:m.361182 g.361182  ORF g.361182 m.361182 type:complete len:63 (-) comp19397_c0_seq1:310-498(-)
MACWAAKLYCPKVYEYSSAGDVTTLCKETVSMCVCAFHVLLLFLSTVPLNIILWLAVEPPCQ